MERISRKYYDPDMHGVTQGLLGDYIDCPQKAWWVVQLWTKGGRRLAMDFGSGGHEVLEDLYNHYSEHKAPRSPKALVEEASGLAVQSINTWVDNEIAGTMDVQRMEDLEFIRAVVPALMPGYVATYTKDFRQFNWLGVESEFAVEYHDWLLRGKRDGVFTYPRQKTAAWVLESKFKGKIDEWTLGELLQFDFQNQFYLRATKQELPKKMRTPGVLYNVVRRPQLRQGKAESLEAFASRVEADVASRPEFYFKRFELSYPAPIQKAFEEELKYKLDKFGAWLAGNEPTYKNQRACSTTYGTCDFVSACASGTTAGYIQRDRIFEELTQGVGEAV